MPIGGGEMASLVRFELVPPTTAFQFGLPDNAEVVRIGADGYETDDLRVISELDAQTQFVRRAEAPAAAKKASAK
jgi:hypothetical protein